MANSALSGNTQGLASATTPGLVSTTAQTFAGAKTFQDGAVIKGSTSGSAVPAGYVGEKITWLGIPGNQSLTTSYADWTNASINLTSGIWLIQANITAGYDTGSTAGNAGAVFVAVTDTANNIVQNMEKQIACKTVANASNSSFSALSFSFVANLPTSAVYKIRAKKSDSSGVGAGAIYNSSGSYSEFFAIRIG